MHGHDWSKLRHVTCNKIDCCADNAHRATVENVKMFHIHQISNHSPASLEEANSTLTNCILHISVHGITMNLY